MKTRVYLKEHKEKHTQKLFVVVKMEYWPEISRRMLIGYQQKANGEWEDWEMAEKQLNRRMKQGYISRIQ